MNETHKIIAKQARACTGQTIEAIVARFYRNLLNGIEELLRAGFITPETRVKELTMIIKRKIGGKDYE